MTALIATVFVSSLLGSLHCAGMCGGLVTFAVGLDPDPRAGRGRWRLHAAYNFGRLATYVLLGAASGLAGHALDRGGALLGIQRAAALLAGALMILFGVGLLARLAGLRLPQATLPASLTRLLAAAQRGAARLAPVPRAATVGLLTGLLPCGWLWVFAITAAGTGSPLLGALTMAVFWVGTLPVLVSLGVGLQHLAGAARRKLPLITALAIVVVGLFTVVSRSARPMVGAASPAVVADPNTAAQQLRDLEQEQLPCCRHDESP